MDLHNRLDHVRKTKINVNGHTYSVDGFGNVRNVPVEDAKRLLANASGVWTELAARAPVGPSAKAKADPTDQDPETSEDPQDLETQGQDPETSEDPQDPEIQDQDPPAATSAPKAKKSRRAGKAG